MRKVRTALDTAIRTKNVRSFSGRAGWHERSTRGHPGRYAAGTPFAGTHWRKNAAAITYRKEALSKLSPSQRRAFEKLPAKTQEELLIKAEKRIDRRIGAGRYRDYGTAAAVAEGSAGIRNGRNNSRRSRARTFSEQMDEYGWNDYRPITGQSGYSERKTDPVLPDDLYSRSIRRRRMARQFTGRAREKRIKAWRKAMGGSRTGNPVLELKDQPTQGGGFGENSRESGNPGNGDGSRKRNGAGSEKQRGTGDKAGKKISHDYARTLGRLIESQVRFTKQLENSRMAYQKQKTLQEMEAKEARRAYRIVSFSLSRLKAAGGELVKAVRFLASKGKGYLILLLVPVMLLVMMVPLLLSSVSMSEEPIASATAEELVEYALSWVGVTRYILGAGRAYETDWQDYTDCSGFVHGVFSHFGFEIGGNTTAMEDDGTLIDTNSTASALPGDIILFFTGRIAPGNSSHVGIYIGDGKMVHCSGGSRNVSPETAGIGVVVGKVANDSRPYQVRRIIPEGVSGGVGTGGHRVDPTNYSTADLQLIWAIVAQEDNGSYAGALAVISSAMNRTESPTWSYLGNAAMKQLCAPGQYCYSNDHYWEARLGGNVPEYVKQAVNDCLKKGIRNHSFTSFRSTKGKTTGPNAVQIGGNWFFGN